MVRNTNEINHLSEQRALLDRVLASPAFARSPRLSSFLSFVCEKLWAGDLTSVTEHHIGVAVFGRAEGYNPSEDNIVRSQARLLRQKLDAYFENEGAGERYLLSIAKGAYVPEFHDRATVPSPISPRRHWLPFALLVSFLALAAFVVYLRMQAPSHPLVASFWRGILAGPKPALIVPGDTALVLIQDLTLQKIHLSEYLSGEYRVKLHPPEGMSNETLLRIARRRYTGVIDAQIAARLAQRAEGKPVVRFARDLRFAEVKSTNLILLGAPHANPWLEIYEKKMNFWLDLDLTKANFTVQNRQPQPGEKATYETKQSDPRQPIWAVISYIPNLEAEGSNGKVLILAGASVAGTEAAAEFVLNDGNFEKFLAQAPGGKPSYFNLLLETFAVDGNSPSARPIAWRFFGTP